MINKNSLKFVGVFVIVIIAVLAALYYVNYYFSPEQKALRYYAELERQYAEDTYGGKTPEETLQLFIDALKAGDIELASKYFVVDKQKEILDYLIGVKNNNNMLLLLKELSFEPVKREFGSGLSSYIFDFHNKQDDTHIIFDVGKLQNGTWKITDM